MSCFFYSTSFHIIVSSFTTFFFLLLFCFDVYPTDRSATIFFVSLVCMSGPFSLFSSNLFFCFNLGTNQKKSCKGLCGAFDLKVTQLKSTRPSARDFYFRMLAPSPPAPKLRSLNLWFQLSPHTDPDSSLLLFKTTIHFDISSKYFYLYFISFLFFSSLSSLHFFLFIF